MSDKPKVKGRLSSYIKWPLYMSAMLITMTLFMYYYDVKAGLYMTAFTLAYIVLALVIYFIKVPAVVNGFVEFAAEYGQVQRHLLKTFAVPYALLDDRGKFVWCNEAFSNIYGGEGIIRKSVSTAIPEITRDKLPTENNENELFFSIDDKDYRALLKKVDINSDELSASYASGEFEGNLIALFLFDETEINRYIRLNNEEKMVTGIIYLDNYDEALETVESVRGSLLTALIDRRINKYFAALDAIVRKTDADKYFVVMKKKGFDQLLESRFDLLEEVKHVNIGNDMAVTLSMGFGVGGKTYYENASYAKTAIDLALGRGGDQAVVKAAEKITYFGGKSQQVEKNTRVKARVKAHALREIIDNKERVIVMGHAMSDVDCFGSGVGIYCAAAHLGKKCNIVINQVTTSIKTVLNDFKNSPDYEEGTIVSSSEALNLVGPGTVLVVVDTNKPAITECPELLNICKTIVVLDHHRQGADKIENATLSYIEPYASSACEMVAEILQYIDDGLKPKNTEADCLYAGIVIDTNNFTAKTGVRTFEAAAYLRRNGADVTRVRKIFRESLADCQARAEAISNAEIYRGEYAISVCPSEGLESPTIVGAQAANELLDIKSVKASFIITQHQGRIFVSARSIDEVNVQIIMEKLGGGGHMTIAGAQIEDRTPEEAIELVKDVLDDMIRNKEI